jgi:hypothetical protein
MHSSLADLIHAWHDFYLLVGTASATLVGSDVRYCLDWRAGFHRKKSGGHARVHQSDGGAFHCRAPYLHCRNDSHARSAAVDASAPPGRSDRRDLLRKSRVSAVHSPPLRRGDRLFYALLPVAGYALVLAASVLLLAGSEWSLEALAAAVITLLLAGIRNAWDMTLWIVIRVPVSEGTREGSP